MTATTFGAPDQSAWPLAPADGVVEVRPGDDDAMLLVEGWFAAYRETGDLAVRERIVLAYSDWPTASAAARPSRSRISGRSVDSA